MTSSTLIVWLQFAVCLALIGYAGSKLSRYGDIILFVYFIAMRTLFRYEHRQRAAYVGERIERYPDITLREAAVRYALMALVVVSAAAWLPFIGEAIAQTMGWHQTFVGTLFIAFATSVPEIVVTISAVRIAMGVTGTDVAKEAAQHDPAGRQFRHHRERWCARAGASSTTSANSSNTP